MVAKLDVLEGDADLESSLGSGELDLSLYTRRGVQSLDQRQWARGVSDDREADGDGFSAADSDFEPSLGSSGETAASCLSQAHWVQRATSPIVDGEAEHDGREPEEDADTGDDEPDQRDLPAPEYVSDYDQMHYARNTPLGVMVSDASMGGALIMKRITSSRRGILTAIAAAFPLAASAAPLTLVPVEAGSAADLGRRYFAARKEFCRSSGDEEDAEWGRVNALFNAACDAPIVTRADAAMKVRLGALSIDEGKRTDERDIQALEQVVRWLEAN